MIQPIRHQARLPFLALVVIALAILTSITLVRITSGSTTRTEAAVPTIVRTDIAPVEHPVVQAPAAKTDCSAGTYVSGDLAGDTSPTEIYSTMCGKH